MCCRNPGISLSLPQIDLLYDAQHFVLTRPQLVDQGCAPLGVLPAIKAVELRCHLIELFVRKEKLSQYRVVSFLQCKKDKLT